MIGERTQCHSTIIKILMIQQLQLHCTCLWELSVKTLTAHAWNLRAKPSVQLLLLVATRSRDLSLECHVTKHKTSTRSNFPLSNLKKSGTIRFSSSSFTSRGLCPKNFEKRVHPTVIISPRLFFTYFPC